MTDPERITQFINAHVTLPRAVHPLGGSYIVATPHQPGARCPNPEQLAQEFLGLAEFRALQLGTWLGTTDGQAITKAVEMVTPPLYRQDIQLLVAALTCAARLQQREGQRLAGVVALGAVAVAVGLAATAAWATPRS
jgi:hypothetical protein